MMFKDNWPILVTGVFLGVAGCYITTALSETPEQRHARNMAEIQEFAAIAPLAAMVLRAQNGN